MENIVDEVSEFIVAGPAGQGIATELAAERLKAFLAQRFPHYSFRVMGRSPLGDDDGFTIVPIMNRAPRPEDHTANDVMYMLKPLDPGVIPQIRAALGEFRIEASAAN